MATSKMEQALKDVAAGTDMRDAAVDNRVSLDALSKEWHRRKRQLESAARPEPEPPAEQPKSAKLPDALDGWKVVDDVQKSKSSLNGRKSRYMAMVLAFEDSGVTAIALECDTAKHASTTCTQLKAQAKKAGVDVEACIRGRSVYMTKGGAR